MSVLAQFRDAEERVKQRLKELEPAVAEYRELEQVAQRLGIKTQADGDGRRATSAQVGRRPTRRAATRSGPKRASAASGADRARRSAGRSAAPGQREQQMLALVRERPGITVAEVAAEIGVDATGLYRVVRRLEQRGTLRKRGRSLEPTGSAA